MDCTLEAQPPYSQDECEGVASRMDVVRGGLAEFFEDPMSAGLAVGLGTFGSDPIGATSCAPGSYSNPVVPFGSLPGQAESLVTTADALLPTGETPTGAAISGACSYFSGWLDENPGFLPSLVLVSDDPPGAEATADCDPTLDEATMAAAGCLENDVPIPTHVIVVGANSDALDLHQLASFGAGRFVADENAEQVYDDLREIVAQMGKPCQFALPPVSSEPIDPNYLNFGVCDAGESSTLGPQVADENACGDSGGWYLTEVGDTLRLETCPATCDELSRPGARAYIEVGCATTRP